MGFQFNIDPTLEEFEQVAPELLRRSEKGEDIDTPEDWVVHRLIILLTPGFELVRQAEQPLALTRERVDLAIEAYRSGERPGVRTYLAGWLPE